MLNYKFDANKIFTNKFEDNNQIQDKSEFMPFWLFCLRYFSSIECINSKFDNYFSKIIDKYIKNYFKLESRKRNNRIRNNWLNFVCNNNKSSCYEPLYIKIKLFLYRLSRDEFFSNLNNNKSYINQKLNNICENLVKDILDNVLQDNFSKLFKNYYTQKDNNDIIDFLKNPNKYLFNKLTDDIINQISKEIDLDENKNAINRIIENIKEILKFEEKELKSDIDNELKRKNDENKELNIIKAKEKKEQILKLLSNDLNKYNNIIDELINNKDYDFEDQIKVEELVKLNTSIIQYIELFKIKEKKIEIIKISYNLKNKIDIIVKNKNDNIIYESSKQNGEFYLLSNNQDFTIIDKNINKPVNNVKILKTHFFYNSFEFKEDIENKYEKLYSNLDENEITLIFGDELSLNKFYENFSFYKNKLKELGDIFSNILDKKDLISNCKLDKINKKYIYNFSNICNVKFSDDKKCEKINDLLKIIKKNLEQINNDYNFISDKFKEIIQNLEINTNYRENILKNDYELKQFPDKIIKNEIVDFSEIKENNLLSIPIINVDPQTKEIFCSYKEVNINIDPFYPSIFSEPYKIHITTFSDISLLIDIKEKEQYIAKDDIIFDSVDNFIGVDDIIESNKPIEIIVKLPKIKDTLKEKEIHILKFNLEILCQKENNDKYNKPFRLPINIRMNLMPIIIRMYTCNKKLQLENNNFLINSNLYEGEEIIFYLEQIQSNIDTKLKPFIQIEGLKDNNSEKPIISMSDENDKTKICINITKEGNKKCNLKSNINFFYTEKIYFSININSDLLNFDYDIKIFDFESKTFIDDNINIRYNYIEKLKEKQLFEVYLKFVFPDGLRDRYKGQIYFENDNNDLIKIINAEEIEQYNFINNNTIIKLNLEINIEIFKDNKIPKIIVKSEINDIIKEANIIFTNEENDIELFENIKIEEYDKIEDNNNDIYYFIENKGIFIESDYKKMINLNKNKDIELEKEKEKENEFNNIKIDLPELKEPKNPLSFQEIDEFYSQCIKIIRALPSYIQFSLKNNNKENIIKAETIFSEIYEYYKLFPLNKKNNSFLYEKIYSFIKSYKDLAKRLTKSGLKLKKSNILELFGINDYELSNDDTQTEYIIKPKPIELDIPEIKNEEYFNINNDNIDENDDYFNIIINNKDYFTEENKSRNFSSLSKYQMGNFLSTKDMRVTSFK